MTKKWLRERKYDYYYRLAKEEGYRSRATYKLLQIAEKYDLIKESDVVVDLGAAPGGWVQAARKLTGEQGYVLGVDLKPISNLGFANVSSFIGDVEKIQYIDILKKIPKKADVVLSDLSPNVSGNWELDHDRQIFLAENSLKLAIDVLQIGGNLLVKVFQGGLLKEFEDKVKIYFKTIRIIKPKASRKESAEVYVLAIKFNGKHV